MKIPMPPTFQIYDMSEEPLTPAEERSHDEVGARLDDTMIGILQDKLRALGFEGSLDEAKSIYNDSFHRNEVEEAYRGLEATQRLNAMIAGIENIQRERGL